MKQKMVALALALATAVSVSACQTPQQQNAVVGGALGAGTGALVGSAVSGGSAGGTLAGAAIGAGTGALIGSAATPQPTYYGGASAPMRPMGLRLQRQPGLHRLLLSRAVQGIARPVTLRQPQDRVASPAQRDGT